MKINRNEVIRNIMTKNPNPKQNGKQILKTST